MLPNTQLLLKSLRRVPLFNELSDNELVSIAENVTIHRYYAGEVVFTEGERGGDLLMVKEGSVKVVKMSASGRHQLIAIERMGSSLGEVSAFDGGAYSITAIAIEPTTLLRLNGEHLKSLCMANPAVALKVIRVLGHRLRHLRKLVEELSFATVRNRLITHLLCLAEELGVQRDTGIEVVLNENNEEIAARLGTVRELVSRNFGRLHGEGLIVVRRRAVTIVDEAKLRAELS